MSAPALLIELGDGAVVRADRIVAVVDYGSAGTIATKDPKYKSRVFVDDGTSGGLCLDAEITAKDFIAAWSAGPERGRL